MSLLSEDIIQFEVFEPSLHLWITTSLKHTFTVKSGCHLFLWHFGVSQCANFDEDLQITQDSKHPVNIRTNMHSGCQITHSKNKTKASSQPGSQGTRESDSEVEIVEIRPPHIASKRHHLHQDQ